MTSSTRSENKRKIDDLTKEVAEIRELAERTAADQEATRRRLDRVDKSTMIVVEFTPGILKLCTRSQKVPEISRTLGRKQLQQSSKKLQF